MLFCVIEPSCGVETAAKHSLFALPRRAHPECAHVKCHAGSSTSTTKFETVGYTLNYCGIINVAFGV
jgi:hypothetical protein